MSLPALDDLAFEEGGRRKTAVATGGNYRQRPVKGKMISAAGIRRNPIGEIQSRAASARQDESTSTKTTRGFAFFFVFGFLSSAYAIRLFFFYAFRHGEEKGYHAIDRLRLISRDDFFSARLSHLLWILLK